MTMTSHCTENLSKATNKNATHKKGVTYNPVQNNRASVGWISPGFSIDSNTHSLLPSSLTLFHHLNPTSNRPVTFFTVQKSKARSKMHTTQMNTKLEEKKPPKR